MVSFALTVRRAFANRAKHAAEICWVSTAEYGGLFGFDISVVTV